MKKKLNIIYEDKHLLVVSKPAKLLCVSTPKEKERTLYHEVYTYLKQKNKQNKVFIVHRLDKDTSGIVLFAKDIKTKTHLQNNWNNIAIERKYLARVEGITPDKGTIQNHLQENKTHIVYVTNNQNAPLAITKYQKISSTQNTTLLDIEIKTGKKNQIRVALSSIGHPIIGDNKYGSTTKSQRLLLHAYKLAIINPYTHEKMIFTASPPPELAP